MKHVTRFGTAMVVAVALTLVGCQRTVSGPGTGLHAFLDKGGSPHGGGGGGGGSTGSSIAVQVTMTDGPISFTDQSLSGTFAPALTSDGQGSYTASVGSSSSDPDGRLVMMMSSKGSNTRCANVELKLVSGNQADLPQTGCEAVTLYTNSRNGEVASGCTTCNENGFFGLSVGDTALQGGSVRWSPPHSKSNEWVVVLDPAQYQIDSCQAHGISTADLSPRGQGVFIKLLQATPDSIWSVEPVNENGHLYGLLRSTGGSECIAVVEFPFKLEVEG